VARQAIKKRIFCAVLDAVTSEPLDDAEADAILAAVRALVVPRKGAPLIRSTYT
jgi:hypothetical protein